MLSRLAPLVAAGIGLLVLAQGVPWPPGERLTYNLTWQGIGVGRVYLSADPVEGGWRFRMKLEPTGLAKALGYGLGRKAGWASTFAPTASGKT